MSRLFVALSIPEIVADALSVLQSGLEGAHWRPIENFHLTLAFIGETDRHGDEAAIDALTQVDAPTFELTLSGLDHFGGSQPRSVYAKAASSEPLKLLNGKIETALRRSGFRIERRRFVPHVTLAYLKGVPLDDVARYTSAHGLFACGPFSIRDFHLYSSRLGGEASHYEIEASYSLASSR